jgi:hypothetical protein
MLVLVARQMNGPAVPACLERPPLRHHDLELLPGVAGILPGEGDHFRLVIADSGYLGPMVLDPAVSGDDEPLA